MNLIERTNESLQKMSVLALKFQQKKKLEDLQSMQRNYNYSMKKIVYISKEKDKQHQKQRQRSLFLGNKHAQSQKMFKLKAQLDESHYRKKLSLKESIIAHKVQKNKSLSFLDDKIFFEAHTQRKYKELVNQIISSDKHQIYQQNRKIFLHSKSLQQQKKKQKKHLQNKTKTNSELNQQQRWNKQYRKLEELQNQQDQKNSFYQKGLKKAMRSYFRLEKN